MAAEQMLATVTAWRDRVSDMIRPVSRGVEESTKITDDQVLAWIAADQAKTPAADREFIKYTSFHVLHNASVNLSAHKTAKVRTFLEQHPQVHLHFTPTYSSWLNQVEIWFSRIEREVIARGIFTSVHDLSRKLMRYIRAYSKTARPFQWKYSDVRRRVPAC